MDDEDEVDVLGDFCLNLDTDLSSYDGGELPSHSSGLLGDYMQHPWLMDHSQAWYFDHTTEEKSKASLEVMLEEEKKHFPTAVPPVVPIEPSPPPNTNGSTTSSSSSQKVSPTWTSTDISSLKEGIKQYGQEWSKIARKIGTKTTLQVKSYVKLHPELVASASRPCSRPGSRAPSPPNYVNEVEIAEQDPDLSYASLVLLDEAQIPASIEEVIASVTTGQPTILRGKKDAPLKSVRGKSPKKGPLNNSEGKKKRFKKPVKDIKVVMDENILPIPAPIDPEPGISLAVPSAVKLEGEIIRLKKTSECVNSESEEEVNIDIEDEDSVPQKAIPAVKETILAPSPEPLPIIKPEPELESEPIAEQKLPEEETNTVESSDESQPVFYFPAPTESREIDPASISEEEKRVHWDFFEGKPSKTPERYVKIRNIIVQEWKRAKPRYLTKTSVRQYLKNCGDVNCISRIHAYLELTGAINFGCDKVSYDKPLPPVPSVRERYTQYSAKKLPESVDLPPARIRKKRQISDEDRDGGYTIQHDADGNEIICKPQTPVKIRKQKKVKNKSEDPFQLVPYVSFDSELSAPFEVHLSADALIAIDVHSHLCTTEVIGLLGGRLYTTNETPVLCIEAAQPCRSLSTGHQCEMCPVSQTEESEKLRASGLQVVGWYHSHPTFPARPSLRDVHTQENFQQWFSKQEAPFVGIIVNPYSSTGTKSSSAASSIRCLTVYDGLPYKHELSFTSSFYDEEKIRKVLKNLFVELQVCPTLVPFSSNYPYHIGSSDTEAKLTYGTKILSSLKSHLQDVLSPQQIDEVCDFVKECVSTLSNQIYQP